MPENFTSREDRIRGGASRKAVVFAGLPSESVPSLSKNASKERIQAAGQKGVTAVYGGQQTVEAFGLGDPRTRSGRIVRVESTQDVARAIEGNADGVAAVYSLTSDNPRAQLDQLAEIKTAVDTIGKRQFPFVVSIDPPGAPASLVSEAVSHVAQVDPDFIIVDFIKGHNGVNMANAFPTPLLFRFRNRPEPHRPFSPVVFLQQADEVVRLSGRGVVVDEMRYTREEGQPTLPWMVNAISGLVRDSRSYIDVRSELIREMES